MPVETPWLEPFLALELGDFCQQTPRFWVSQAPSLMTFWAPENEIFFPPQTSTGVGAQD